MPLLADLADAAGDDVVDDCRIDTGAFDRRFERVGQKIDGMYSGQLPALLAAAERSADGLDDYGFAHSYTFLVDGCDSTTVTPEVYSAFPASGLGFTSSNVTDTR